MSSSYNTPCSKHNLVVSIYSNTETSLMMSTLAIRCRVVRSRDAHPCNMYGLALSSLAMSVPTVLMVSRCQVSRFQSPVDTVCNGSADYITQPK